MTSLIGVSCPFCEIVQGKNSERIIEENQHAFLIGDGFPVTTGHSLIIPKRHISTFFDTTEEERGSLYFLLDKAKSFIDKDHEPDSYNIGINDGPAAGQTVPHLHVHLIPRYAGEDSDPRGGVRWIIPDKANYWGDK